MPRLAPAAKHIRIIATAIVLTVTGYLLLSHPTTSRSTSNNRGLNVSPVTLDILAQARLEQLQRRYDEEEVHREVGLKIGNPGWGDYVEELQGVYERYFRASGTATGKDLHAHRVRNTTPDQSSLVQEIQNILAKSLKLSARDNSHAQRNSIPHTIHTTSKKREFPEQFSSWRRLNVEDGWKVQYYDNAGIWRWMVDIFGHGSQTATVGSNTEGARILKEYGQLPTGVLRDTDTACVRPIRDWPGIRENHWEITTKTDPILSVLPNVYDLLSVASIHDTRHDTESISTGGVRNRMAELEAFEPPRLVVALEYDHWVPGSQDWRELGFSRGMQFVQWTMMAQPGHPVFLDTLNRIMRDVETHRVLQQRDSQKGAQGEEEESARYDRLLDVLDFTGPGVFSDAVFRYLLVRWGVHPRDISGASGGQRIGDVLGSKPAETNLVNIAVE
ncbi:hypothetical protein QFC21_005525 [Naganishia friedmannii]|uniref:Uncharacterized protein n=1 Tax=Naganishia friedmannii TaxID=89922 RepID=A0ACC2V957_9TREE|nr:hypothetical protein QFC21_005525 [Naganishia friedmannii]